MPPQVTVVGLPSTECAFDDAVVSKSTIFIVSGLHLGAGFGPLAGIVRRAPRLSTYGHQWLGRHGRARGAGSRSWRCADSAHAAQDGLPFVIALKPRRGTWACGPDAHTPVDAARALAWNRPDPGDWQPVTRAFRDGTPRPDAPPTRPSAGGDRTGSASGDGHRRPGIRHWIEQGHKRSKTTWAGPTSRSAPMSRSATRSWSTARSPSAGTSGTPIRHRWPSRRRQSPAAERGTRPATPGRRPGPGRSGPCGVGSPCGSRCSAGGPHGRTRPRPGSCKP
jgi:hypothetical protein